MISVVCSAERADTSRLSYGLILDWLWDLVGVRPEGLDSDLEIVELEDEVKGGGVWGGGRG
jgi:hypothetical protein